MLKRILGLFIAVLMLTQPLYAIAQAEGENPAVGSEIQKFQPSETPDAQPTETPTAGFTIGEVGAAFGIQGMPPTPSYTIKYHYNYPTGGNGVSETVSTSATIVLESPPTYPEGYTFVGWSRSGSISAPYYEDGTFYTITENGTIHFYGAWEPKTYTVTFAAGNHGSLSGTNSFNVNYSTPWSDVAVPTPIGSTGYEFEKWSPLHPASTYLITNALSFTASFEPISYNITYNLDGGTNHSSNPSAYTVESAITLAAPTKAGFRFVEWQENGVSTMGISAGNTGAKIFTAVWEKVNTPVYIITYVLGEGGVNGANPANYDANTLPVTFNAPTRDGYVFVEWQDENSNTATGILEGSTGERAFTAIWDEDTDRDGVADKDEFRVTYNLNGGGGTTPVDTYLYSGIGSQSMFTAALQGNINRFGYTFLGWDTDEIAAAAKIAAGTAGNAINTTTGSITLYAIWQLNQYTITYTGLAGSSFAVTNPNVTTFTIETPTFAITNPTRGGYNFTGWTGTGLDTNTTGITIEKGSTGNRTYTANWQFIFIPANVTPTLPPLPVTPAPTVAPSAPVTPAATATPAPVPTASPSPALTTIPEESTPLGPSPAAGLTEIPDEAVPLEAQPETTDVLTLVNLIAMVLTVIGAVLLLFKKSKKDEETRKEESGFKRTGTKVISLVAAVGGIVLFFLTQPLTGLDIWDKYSAWQLLILAVYIAMAIVAYMKKKTQDKAQNADA